MTYAWHGFGIGWTPPTTPPAPGTVSGSSQLPGSAVMFMDPQPSTVIVVHPPVPIPAAITQHPVYRESHIMPALTVDAGGTPIANPGTYEVIREAVGYLHVWVGGVDVTYLRDVPTQIDSYSAALPFGERGAQLTFPQATSIEAPLTGLDINKRVDIAFVNMDGTTRRSPHQWAGQIVSRNGGNNETQGLQNRQCEGALYQADHAMHLVPIRLAPTDLGTLVASAFNSVVSRKYSAIAPIATGQKRITRGSQGDTELAYAAGLLSTSTTLAGQQWTVERTGLPRQFKIGAKPHDERTPWTYTYGAPGVTGDLTVDGTQAYNVIYGHGVGPDGYAWSGRVWPNLLPADPPDYPWADASNIMRVGVTDADTDTGHGVTVWQRRMVELGYPLAVDGSFDAADQAVCFQLQAATGSSYDGEVGPQTWAASWRVGMTDADINSSRRMPLAIDPAVEPWLYNAMGGRIGANPAYDSGKDRSEIDIDWGTDITKAEGMTASNAFLARHLSPGWTGTFDLTTCPHEGFRGDMREGDPFILAGYEGANVNLHIVELSVETQPKFKVSVRLDSKYRDAMELDAILARDRESAIDPTRAVGPANRRSRQEADMTVPFEGDSPAGRIPRIPINGDSGLWTVWPVPLEEVGRIAKLYLQTILPATSFAWAIFGRPITANQLALYVGNPLTQSDPYKRNLPLLEDTFWFIEAGGQQGQRAGYWPGQESNAGDPVTGTDWQRSGIESASDQGGWVHFAFFATQSCKISGRAYPAQLL